MNAKMSSQTGKQMHKYTNTQTTEQPDKQKQTDKQEEWQTKNKPTNKQRKTLAGPVTSSGRRVSVLVTTGSCLMAERIWQLITRVSTWIILMIRGFFVSFRIIFIPLFWPSLEKNFCLQMEDIIFTNWS